MGWEQIINQKKIQEYFQKILRDKTFANAYCFYGKEGVGKFAIIMEIVKSLNCSNPIIGNKQQNSCGQCLSCQNIENLKFPNIEYVFSLPSTSKSTQGEAKSSFGGLPDNLIQEINEKLKNKIKNPYAGFSIEGASQIKISQIRELRRTLALSNSIPGHKFVIILNAEEMRVEAQNAFLKTLEEPRKDVTFILLTTRKESLLPTILSRCQLVFFPPIDKYEIKNILIDKFNKTPEESEVLARFANGSITKLIELMDENIIETRNLLIDLLRLSLKNELPGRQLTEKINSLVEKFDKKKASFALDLLQQWFRDAILITRNGTNDSVVNYDNLDTIVKFCKKFGRKPIEKAIEIIENSHYLISTNVQISNVFLNLFLEFRKILF